MKKRVVFKKYHYRECDSFADYLERMAAKGWIFKGWRLGLVFYKDQPRKETYAAEIFPEGDEKDKRPEPNTREYARYCEEAGWELVDSTGKFCVFRKIREDALPIVTEEERYENVCKAEWVPLKKELILSCLIEVFLCWGLYTSQLITFLFSDIFLLILLNWNLIFLEELLLFTGFARWKISSERRLKEGREILYGKRKAGVHIWAGVRSLLFIFIIGSVMGGVMVQSILEKDFRVFVFFGLELIFTLLMLWLRLSREKETVAYLIFTMILFYMMFAVPTGISAEKRAETEQTADMELKNPYGSGTLEERDFQKGILGARVQYSISFQTDGGEAEENRAICYGYSSETGWILERIYALYIRDGKDISENNLWGTGKMKQNLRKAETAVWSADKVFYIVSRKGLDKDQILFLRQALDL